MNVVEEQIQSVEEPVGQPVQKLKRSFSVPHLIKSPWVLLAAPLTAGAVWLASNTWVITNNLDKPYALLAGPTFVGSIIALYVLLMFFKGIVAMVKGLAAAVVAWLKKPGAVFWVGTGIFLVVSIAEGSSVYDEIFKNTFHGLLGFAAAVSIDAVSVTCILARQDASRRNNTFGKNFFMIGIVACALISTIANGYITTEHYSAPTNIAGTAWVIGAYALGLVPPLFIVFLGFASDYISDQKASSLDPEAFQKSERDRLRFYEIQLETLKERKRINDAMDRINGAKERRVFFLFNWLFPKQVQDASAQIGELRVAYDEQMKQFGLQMTHFMVQAQQNYQSLAQLVQGQIAAIDAQKDTDLSLISQQITASQKATIETVQHRINQSKDETISIIQIRLNEVRENIASECLSSIPNQFLAVSEMNTYHPFSHEDEMQIEDVLDTPENVAESVPENDHKEEQKTKKSSKSTGYQIESDPIAQEVVQNYPIVERWLSTGAKSASLKEIEEVTGHSHRMVLKRFADSTLKKTSRNPNAITMESIIKWLSTEKLPRSKNADREESIQTNEVPQTPPIEMQSSDILDASQNDENLTDTGEHETLSESAIEEGMNALNDIDLRDYQPVPMMVEMAV